MPLIVEGLLTTVREGRVNLAPMGPIVEDEWSRLVLRPFEGSTTCENLLETRCGVFHVIDDVELLARTAIGRQEPLPPLRRCAAIEGWVLEDACRWFALRVTDIETQPPRYTLTCEVIDAGQGRPHFGFNRAKHAVVEAAILATRAHLLPPAEIAAEMLRLAPLVEKTGGSAERRAWDLLAEHIARATRDG